MNNINRESRQIIEKFRDLEGFCHKFNSLGKELNIDVDVIDNSLSHKVSNVLTSIEKQIAIAEDANRKISLGIIGQVKVGKSSFLNALIFDGKNILPKAATPMTASLTKISYGAHNRAIVHFFNEKDWTIIEDYRKKYLFEKERIRLLCENRTRQKRDKYDSQPEFSESELLNKIPEEFKVSDEIYNLAKTIPNLHSYFEKQSEVVDFADIDEVKNKLGNFVGVGGTLSPLVKFVELELNLESLRDLEIVDTPGMNDPVMSRGKVTEEYLKQCDTAFLLSYCGQFLSEEDTEFLVDLLPYEGISRVTLIGSKFDSVLLDKVAECLDNKNFTSLKKDLANQLIRRAKDMLKPIIESRMDKPVFQKMSNSMSIELISGIAYNMSSKPPSEWDSDEIHMHKRLSEEFPDFEFTPERLRDLSGIDRIKKDTIQKIVEDKKQILGSKLAEILSGKIDLYSDICRELNENLQEKYCKIKSGDVHNMKKEEEVITHGLEDSIDNVRDVFDLFISELSRNIKEKIRSLREQAKSLKEFETIVKEDWEEIRTKKSGILPWFGRLLGLGGYETKRRLVVLTYAKIRPVIDNIENYIDNINDVIENCWKYEIDKIRGKTSGISEFTKRLIEAVEDAFDMQDSRYDPRFLKKTIRNIIDEIEYPVFKLDAKKYTSEITSSFGIHNVEGDANISELASKVTMIVHDIIRDMSDVLGNLLKDFELSFSIQGKNFNRNIEVEVKKQLEELKIQIESREAFMSLYSDAIGEFNRIKLGEVNA